tara:strand:- start:926 stop:1516 length:591 start_codon:yes stop_codon:yes gene_type:complete
VEIRREEYRKKSSNSLKATKTTMTSIAQYKKIFDSIDSSNDYIIYSEATDIENYKDSVIVTCINNFFTHEQKCLMSTKNNDINLQFFYKGKPQTECIKFNYPNDDTHTSIQYSINKGSCGKFVCEIIKEVKENSEVRFLITKRYYINKKRKRREIIDLTIEDTNLQNLIGITTPRTSKRPKKFIPNFEKPSTSSYY